MKALKACSYGHAGKVATLFKSLGLFTGMPIVGDTDIVCISISRQTKQTTSPSRM